MNPIDLMLRTAAVLALALLAGLVWRVRRRDHTPRLGALCCIAVIAFVVTSAPGADRWLGGWAIPLTALCVAMPAWFWLFAKGLFSDVFRVRPRHLVIVGLVAGYGLWQQLALVERARSAATAFWEVAASLGFQALILALVLSALFEAYRGLAADLLERRRRLRILFVVVAGGYTGIAVLVQAYNLALDAVTPPPVVWANLTAICALGLAAAWTLIQMRPTSWLDPDPQLVARGLRAAEERVLAALQRALENHHVYRDPGLTIGRLASRLGASEHTLRHVINGGLGFRNFNDFLHSHRIHEACARLRRPDGAQRTILSIALDVGYGSIGPFNRAFKERMGMTPSSFRRAAAHHPHRSG